MPAWTASFRAGALPGTLASVLSAAVLLLAGHRRAREPAAPVNAVSHWVWGDPALHADRPTLRHTLVGYGIHHGASLFWSTLHAHCWGRAGPPLRPGRLLAQAGLTTAAACLVDLRLTPHRFTPGFEHRLAARHLVAVYGSFAVGLALGTALVARSRFRPAPWRPPAPR